MDIFLIKAEHNEKNSVKHNSEWHLCLELQRTADCHQTLCHQLGVGDLKMSGGPGLSDGIKIRRKAVQVMPRPLNRPICTFIQMIMSV